MKRAYSNYKCTPNWMLKNFLMPQEETLLARLLVEQGDNIFHFCKTNPRVVTVNIMKYLLVVSCSEQLKEGNATHYFLTEEKFADWLIQCSKHIDHNAISQMIPNKKAVECIHFPGQNQKSILYMIQRWTVNGIPKEYTIFYHKGDGFFPKIYNSPGCNFAKNWAQKTFHISNEIKLLVSLIAYMTCFPDAVFDGIPNDLKHPNHFKKSRCLNLTPHSSLCVNNNSPAPHYRQGHFRFLGSEYFKGKRGSVVFVERKLCQR